MVKTPALDQKVQSPAVTSAAVIVVTQTVIYKLMKFLFTVGYPVFRARR